MTDQNAAYSPGLEGVVAGISRISHIDLDQNVLTYRGYNVQDLCDRASFEETAYLLLYGELPTDQQIAEFQHRLTSRIQPPDYVFDILRRIPVDSQPMDWLKVAVASTALAGESSGDRSNLDTAIDLTAQMPALVAGGWRILQGLEPVTPKPGLSHAAQLLWLITGEEPDEFSVKALNTTLILYAEHGFNASTFVARVTVSTLSDLASGVVAAIGALKGPLHGGANEEVMKMLLDIGQPANAIPWLEQRLTKTPDNPRPRVMGFGHREYKRGDQRAQIVKQYTRKLAERTGQLKWVEIADALEETMLDRKGLHPNLDFPVSPAYYMMGLPIPLYTPIFVVSRVVGWSAHIIEQLSDNRLIRPTNLYDGPPRRDFVPMERRA